MSTTTGFLAVDHETSLVTDWFANHPNLAMRTDRPDGHWFAFGPPVAGVNDPKRLPLVYVVVPRRIRGALWTAGEVGFTPTKLRQQFPGLAAAHRQFMVWIRHYERVLTRPPRVPGPWDHYLKGGIRNSDCEFYALPGAATALRSEQYFVRDEISDRELDELCSTLRLRGVAC